MRPYRLRTCLLYAAILLGIAGPAQAWELVGTKQLELRTRDGTSIPIGTVTFTPGPDATRFVVTLDRTKFKDFFLSMREFKCVEGPEVQCHVPYPYANPGTVRPGDYAWLEHALLFLYKAPADYGAKLSNGLYYALQKTEDGLVGRPMAVDLNDIAAPPQDPSVPPFDQAARADIVPGARWIEALVIR
ncbi:hypothetical protein ABID82_001645 [Methylobacterium sp. PvP062]|jgi:hypothetical protein|uniref:Uncharacterized protein n=2 Tax=Methylobacterium TaxID=407 RepID=A0A509E9M0_9HYPH|nr:hypothetical protein [Methylobacterium organophilum]MWV21424.1 hypothetical protein [Methylobacterium sp. 2A]GAN46056.1 hypothetical protein ME121_0059 [Methylobacterium sp. ME121]SDM28261.1 hypothetical protein SAMN05216360_101429 [Methylobacterium phyllostachyos]VUD70907.1 hypothetical protein MET9862_01481 [Methylobacterium symbioticum]